MKERMRVSTKCRITSVCRTRNRRIHMAIRRILSISHVWFMAQSLCNPILCNSWVFHHIFPHSIANFWTKSNFHTAQIAIALCWNSNERNERANKRAHKTMIQRLNKFLIKRFLLFRSQISKCQDLLRFSRCKYCLVLLNLLFNFNNSW